MFCTILLAELAQDAVPREWTQSIRLEAQSNRSRPSKDTILNFKAINKAYTRDNLATRAGKSITSGQISLNSHWDPNG
jgi:hypothetical protein